MAAGGHVVSADRIADEDVSPAMGADYHDLETSLLWFSSLAGTSTLLGPLLVAVGVLPAEGYGIIPGTVVLGLGKPAAGWVCRRGAEGVRS